MQAGKCEILCDNGRGGKGGGWQSKGKLRRISLFYDLGSFPQLRSTTTHFPSEEVLQYFQYTNTGKKKSRVYSTEVKNGPSTKNLETYLYFGEQTKAAVIPLHCGGEIPNQKLNQSTNKLFDQVNDSFKKVNIFCTLFYPLMCFFWKTCTFTKTLCSAHVLCLHFTWAQHSGFQGPRYRLLASKALSMH